MLLANYNFFLYLKLCRIPQGSEHFCLKTAKINVIGSQNGFAETENCFTYKLFVFFKCSYFYESFRQKIFMIHNWILFTHFVYKDFFKPSFTCSCYCYIQNPNQGNVESSDRKFPIYQGTSSELSAQVFKTNLFSIARKGGA